ncbi:MAG: PAS domain S-box protein [Deltaproteobacteria bacterium]|uniref:Sensory/regulatory protein RpfC n=1 Tax=Candidatus Desulfacyla euxinica TaxID=2841693 RepID=A0A8J6MY03_9DELT|nr:PAS domain S-box protein [Candidatus Desulfacyla euxinica]
MTATHPKQELEALRSKYKQAKDLADKFQAENSQLTEQVKRLSKTEVELYGIQGQLDTQMQFYHQLYEVGKQFTTTTELNEILQVAIQFVLYELNFERCLVLMYSAKEKAFRVHAWDGYYDEDKLAAVETLYLPEADPTLLQLREEPHRVLCDEACDQEQTLALARKFDMDEYILLPLGGETERPLGLLAAGNTTEMRSFQTRVQPDGDANVGLASLVSHASAAINNVNFYQTLRENEKRYRTLFENAGEAIYIAQDGKIKFPNPKTLEIYGYSEEELSSKPFTSFIHEKDQQMVLDRHKKRLKGEALPSIYSFRIVSKDGEIKWVKINVVSVSWDGRPATLCFMTDITEQIQNDEILRQSEEKYRTILESIEDGYFELDLSGNLSFFNDSMCRILGYPKNELMGMNYKTYMSQETAKEVYEIFTRVYTTGEPDKCFNWRIRKKNGAEVYVESSVSLMEDAAGQRIGFRGIGRDISERYEAAKALKENEEKYRTLFEDSRDAIFISDPRGKLIDVNKSVLDLFGYTRSEMVQLSFWDTYVNPDERTSLYQAIEQTGTVRDFELKLQTKNGAQMDCLLTATARRADDGRVLAYQGIVRDITERKRVEADLQKHREHLEELVEDRTAELAKASLQAQQAREAADDANAAKSSFLANMSHELRTPMNAVIGMTHLAIKTELTPKQYDYLSKIQSSAHSLLGIINDILDFSKIEAGKLDMESVDFSLDDVLENLTNLITVRAQEKKDLEVLFAIDPDVPRLLVGDPLRLGQVLINLANNAVKFTEAGEIVISTELLKQEDEQVTLKFSVRDTGLGLTQEQIARLFQAFTQADTSTTRKFGGTGLGLTISKRLVNMMHGEIWVESEPGQGSTFMFTATFGCGREKDKDRFKPLPDLRGMKVLVVDDNATSREILESILTSFSFEASLASSGEEGLTELENADEKHPYKLVIMDYRMPGIDGIEAARRIKQHTNLKTIPAVVMVTNYGTEEVMEMADEAELDGFLLKPVNPSVLFDAIMHAVGKDVPKRSLTPREDDRECVPLQKIRGARVLLVEDNEINQQVAKEILEAAGLNVSLANNGQEAVEAVRSGAFDAVLMDVQMPVMDGYTATREIRNWEDQFRIPHSAFRIPIIAMTAHALTGDREKSLKAGMNDHVTKPIDPEVLFRTLGKWLKKSGYVATGEESTAETMIKTRVAPNDKLDFPDLDGINVKAGIERLLGNKKSYRRILLRFRQDFENAAESIRNLIDEEKYDEAEILAHSIKGAGANIGAEGLQATAGALEKWIKDGGKGLPEKKFMEFSDELDRMMTSLSSLVRDEDPSVEVEKESVMLPPEIAKEIADRIRNAVDVGDVTELSEIATELSARTDGSSQYEAKIAQLAEDFDFDGLVQLADSIEKGSQ